MITIGKNGIIMVVKERSERSKTDAFNLNLAGQGDSYYSIYPLPLPPTTGGFSMFESTEKVCTDCNLSLLFIRFSRSKTTKDGYQNVCKSCAASRHAEYRKKNKERIALRKAENYQANKERLILLAVEYRKDNKERIALKQAEHYRSNKEQIILKRTEYKKNNPEIYRAIHHRRRANIKKVGGSFTTQQIRLQDKKQKNKCYYCQKKMGTQQSIEHVIPISRGGSNDISNIVLACLGCNLSKHTKLPHEWPQGGRLL